MYNLHLYHYSRLVFFDGLNYLDLDEPHEAEKVQEARKLFQRMQQIWSNEQRVRQLEGLFIQ